MQIVNVKYLCQLPDVAFNRPLPGTHPLRDLTAGEAVGETPPAGGILLRFPPAAIRCRRVPADESAAK